MSQPLRTRYDKNGHRIYKWPSRPDLNFRSVTTIIEHGHPKGALKQWAANMAAKKAVEKIDELQKIVRVDPVKAVNFLNGAHIEYANERAKNGDLVHGAIEHYIRFNHKPKLSNKEAQNKLDQFDRFIDEWNPTITFSETTVFSIEHEYAGTADLGLIINGVPLVGDVKSGKSVWDEAALQMAAYRFADFVAGAGDIELPMFEAEGGVILHLTENSYGLYPVNVSPETFQHFLNIREIYRFQYERDEKLRYKSVRPIHLTKMNGTTPQWVKDTFGVGRKKNIRF